MKLSRQTKEILQIVVFLVAVGAIVYFYWIYPLGKARDIAGRQDELEINLDSLPPNDPGIYAESDLMIDTFRVEADGQTNLACLMASAPADLIDTTADSVAGTVFVLPDASNTRDSIIGLVKQLALAGHNVVTYDLRASGRSSGEYHGEGQYESADLQAVIAWLDIRNRLKHPVSVIGFGLGGEASLLIQREEPRLDQVIAIDPPITTERHYQRKIDEHCIWWFPLRETMLWFWYNQRSSYAANFREFESIRAVKIPTLLLVPESAIDDPEIAKLVELSPEDLLSVTSYSGSEDLAQQIRAKFSR